MEKPVHYTFDEFVKMNDISDDDRYEPCFMCEGDGWHECECGHGHNCEKCHGKGKIDLLKNNYEVLCQEQDKAWEEWHKGVKA